MKKKIKNKSDMKTNKKIIMEEAAPFLCPPGEKSSPKWDEIEADLEQNSDIEKKASALKSLIKFQASGEYPPEKLIITIINYVMPSKDHDIKKLLFLYFEIVETRDRKGELKPIFLLICDAISKDLTHPNEYIRSAALRFISRFEEPNLISTLTSFVTQSLRHNNPYVRRHAVVAIGRIHLKWPNLAPDAPSDIVDLLRTETDAACKRVAFLVLCDISRELATEFLDEIVEGSLLKLSQPMQLTATSLIKTLCSDKRKAIYLPPLLELLESPSAAVKMEAALTLLNLTESTTASQAAFSTLCNLMQTIPNSSLQLSIADQIEKLLPTHMSVSQSVVSELLVSLKAKAIRSKILNFIPKLTNLSNANEITLSLIHHFSNASTLRNNENEKQDCIDFMRLILQTLKTISSNYPIVLKSIFEGIKSFITDSDIQISYDTLLLLRDYGHHYPEIKEIIANQIENLLEFLRSSRVIRTAIFTLSIYTNNPKSIDSICDTFTKGKESKEINQEATTIVLADGTYVTRLTDETSTSIDPSELILNDKFLGASISICLARIICRINNCNISKALNFIEKLISLPGPCLEQRRLSFSYTAIQQYKDETIKNLLIKESEDLFNDFIKSQQNLFIVKPVTSQSNSLISIDERISFGTLLGKKFDSPIKQTKKYIQKTGLLWQMTGTSDPIFCECRTNSTKFDISLEFRLLNQTNQVLNGVHLELNCVGRLELIDRPAPLSLSPNTSETVKFSVKVTSAEAGRVFGSIVYELKDKPERQFLPLAVLTVASSDYMEALNIDPLEFRRKWDAFEWEKKIPIHSTNNSLKLFIEKICNSFKLKVIGGIDDDLPFITSNLYSKSYFGEEVLVNINVELKNNNVIGFIRLRTDSQNMAISFSKLILSMDESI